MKVSDILNEGISKKSQEALDDYDYATFYSINEKKVASFNKPFIKEHDFHIARGMAALDDYDAAEEIASSGKWGTDVTLFVNFLEEIKDAFDDGHPFRNYGKEAVQEILASIDWEHKKADVLYAALKDSYTLKKVDFEYTDYSSQNKAANKAEGAHIRSQGPGYRHD